jgi:hypothetical protein
MSFLTRIFKGNEGGAPGDDPNAPAEADVTPDEPEMELIADPAPAPEPDSGDLVIELVAPPPAAKPAAPARPIAKPTLPGVAPPKAAAAPPTAPRPKANGAKVAAAQSLGDTGKFLAQLDAIDTPSPKELAKVADGVSTPEDLAAVRKLFDEVARGYMAQLRNVMLEVKWGEARTEWLGVCDAVLRSVRKMAEKMEMSELCTALDGFQSAIGKVRKAGQSNVAGADRDSLLAAYEPLLKTMPQVFELDAERNRREPVILQSLLRQVPDVEKLTIDRLYAAGLTSLDLYYRAKPDEIAATTSITLELATRIVELFARYRAGNGAHVGAATLAEEYKQLTSLTAQLRKQHVAFEEASAAWSRDAIARKKELRRTRATTIQQIHVALARLGEVDRVGELEKLSYRRKIEQIERYLEQTRGSIQSAPESKATAQEAAWQP